MYLIGSMPSLSMLCRRGVKILQASASSSLERGEEGEGEEEEKQPQYREER